MEYVVGFLMTASMEHIVLIEKRRPAWQAGRLNGVGGKIEVHETAEEAMIREFREETGCEISNWRQFATLNGHADRRADGEPWAVYFFVAFVPTLADIGTTTDEKVCIIRNRPEIIKARGLPNLNWLIPMAMAMEPNQCFTIHEHKENRRNENHPCRHHHPALVDTCSAINPQATRTAISDILRNEGLKVR